MSAPAAIDPELAEFQAEIGAIEAETEQANRADTPPPDQQRFQDDDGTIYVWDANVRRFVPAAEMAPSTSYDVADMVYEAEDEKIPAMPAAIQVKKLSIMLRSLACWFSSHLPTCRGASQLKKAKCSLQNTVSSPCSSKVYTEQCSTPIHIAWPV